MYTKQALRAFGVRADTLSEARKRQLDQDGFCIVENVLSAADCAAMNDAFEAIFAAENGQGGHEVHIEPGARRVSNIFNKTDAFDKCLEIPEVLAASQHLLGEIKVHGANLRDPVTGYGHQDLHVDVPKKFVDDWWVLNAVITFDEVTLGNGPTRAVPGSHYWAPINVPVVNQGDWEPEPLGEADQARVPTDLAAPYPGEIMVTAPAGAAILMNSSLWHSGTLKTGTAPRRVLHLTYTRRDLPQQLTQIDYLTPELYARMSPEHRFLLDIEPRSDGDTVLRQPQRSHAGWWN